MNTTVLELGHVDSGTSVRVELPVGVDAADVRCTFRRRARQLQATVGDLPLPSLVGRRASGEHSLPAARSSGA